jgi:hypothetical protein
MDVILRSQAAHTRPTNQRSAAIAYATAVTFVIFNFIQTIQAMQADTSSLSTQGRRHISQVVNACKDLLNLATSSKQSTQPNSRALMQYIAVHYKVATATPTPTMPAANIKSIARATATLSFILHTHSIVTSIIPTHKATLTLQSVIITPTPSPIPTQFILLADVVAFNTP